MAKFILTYRKSSGLPPKLVEGRDIVQACINAGTRLATEKRAGMIDWEEVEAKGRHKSINTSPSSSSSSSDSFATGPFSPQAIAFTVLALDSLMD